MKNFRLIAVFLMVGANVSALACEIPTLSQIPADESTQTRTKTLIQLNLIRYIGAMSSYVGCLQNEYELASTEGAPSLHLALLATRNNQAVAETEAMQQVYTALIGPIDELAELERASCIDGGAGLRDIIVDNQTILFYTRRDEVFLNLLSESCPILRSNNSSLNYAVSRTARFVDELCTGSPVFDSSTPASARRCLLGSFYPVTEAEADELRSR